MSPGSTRILHLSDIHFGRIDESVLNDLQSYILSKKSELDLVIITGDLTQRAKKNEFLSARAFLDSLHCPVVVVPGNHDVPLYNIFLRFFAPYFKFCKFLGRYSEHFYENEHVAVYGIWSTNNFSVKDGKVTNTILTDLENKFREVSPHKIKIIASHHGLFSKNEPMKGDAQRVLSSHPHVLLSGHEHQSGVTQLPSRKFPLIISSGTSTSNRLRVEANSFNLITVNMGQDIVVETFVREQNSFLMKKKFETKFSIDE